jgi:hypothetical protein
MTWQSFIIIKFEQKPGRKRRELLKFRVRFLVLSVDLAGHPWSLPFATARCVAVASARPQQQQQMPPERKADGGFMDAGSRSSGGAGFDDDEGHAARREVSSSLKGDTSIIAESVASSWFRICGRMVERVDFYCVSPLASSGLQSPRSGWRRRVGAAAAAQAQTRCRTRRAQSTLPPNSAGAARSMTGWLLGLCSRFRKKKVVVYIVAVSHY